MSDLKILDNNGKSTAEWLTSLEDLGLRVESGSGSDNQRVALYSDGVIAPDGKRGYQKQAITGGNNLSTTGTDDYPKVVTWGDNKWDWYKVFDKQNRQVAWVRVVSSFADEGYRVYSNFNFNSYRSDGTKEYEVSKMFDLRGRCTSTSYTRYKETGSGFAVCVIEYADGGIFTHGTGFSSDRNVVQIFDDNSKSTNYPLDQQKELADEVKNTALSRIPSVFQEFLE